jgi:hypothetical protein
MGEGLNLQGFLIMTISISMATSLCIYCIVKVIISNKN